MTDELERLRQEIRDVDARIVELAARRTLLARAVGDIKAGQGVAIRNYSVEAEVLRLAREQADAKGFPADVAEELVKLLIRESLRAQERDRLQRTRRAAGSNGQRALVVGGAGNMGRWFADFLDSKGFGVAIADPRGAPPGYPDVKDITESAGAFDVVLVATPPSAVAGVLDQLHGARGLVFEIGSLKSPFLDELRAFAKCSRAAAVTSVHPMWGPRTDMLASKNVVVCDVGDAAANRAAKALFEDTAANVFEMPIEEHDRYMARVLGLPHALNLVFGHAMDENGYSLAQLTHLGGPTFQNQLAVTREVAGENKDLYYEIQRLNPHTPEMLRLLRRSLDEFEQAVAARDAFRAYMGDAEAFFGGSA